MNWPIFIIGLLVTLIFLFDFLKDIKQYQEINHQMNSKVKALSIALLVVRAILIPIPLAVTTYAALITT